MREEGYSHKNNLYLQSPDYVSVIYLDDAHDIRIRNFKADKPEGKLLLFFEKKSTGIKVAE